MTVVFVEHDGQRAIPASLTALTLARDLGEEVTALCFGAAPMDDLSAYGVAGVHVVAGVDEYSPERWGTALRQLVDQTSPAVVLAGATDRGNEVMAQAAARARLPLASNCVAVAADGAVTRVRGGGILLEDAAVDGQTRMATVMPTAAEPRPAAEPVTTSHHDFAPDLDGVAASNLVDRAQRGGGVALATASVVVSGGRGVGSAEGFAPLEELAGLLGGAVGCSRVATNNGWRPHSDQVGQTGTKINPSLYIACGISGATQHWVGCMDSKAILAINTDPEAPMVTRATYAVIGDVHEVLHAVIDEVRRRRET